MALMSPEEFKDKMQKIADETDEGTEVIHGDMDDLMCNLLEELGYEEGVKIFCITDKWYA